MSVLGMIVSGSLLVEPMVGIQSLAAKFLLDCCFLRRGRDEVTRHFYRLVFFRSVRPCLVFTAAEVNCSLAGLGELTFLQLSTTYPPAVAGRNIGCVFLEG